MLFGARLTSGLLRDCLIAAVSARAELLAPLSSLFLRLPVGLLTLRTLLPEAFVLSPFLELFLGGDQGHIGGRFLRLSLNGLPQAFAICAGFAKGLPWGGVGFAPGALPGGLEAFPTLALVEAVVFLAFRVPSSLGFVVGLLRWSFAGLGRLSLLWGAGGLEIRDGELERKSSTFHPLRWGHLWLAALGCS